MHSHSSAIDVNQLIRTEPIRPAAGLRTLSWIMVIIGVFTFGVGLVSDNKAHFWAAYYTSVIFFSGIAGGQVALTAILQIVRATWAPALRRIAEAGSSFFPWAYLGILSTYAGKEYLFYWGTHPKPGSEWWMQPDFVYARFAILMGVLYYFMWRFVRISLRPDIGTIREKAKDIDRWFNPSYDSLVAGWQGSEKEVLRAQRSLSFRAPVVILLYGVIISLFAFEMIMGMNKEWFSNMFGGFIFITNIFAGMAMLVLTSLYLAKRSPEYSNILTTKQLWDIGKLIFGFTMLWGYLFFSQFLVQWYGNLPEETQWMILRTREMPWKCLGWVAFSMSFVIPFVLLLSDDLKKTPKAFATVCCVIFLGVWIDRYMIVMPEVSPGAIPFGFMEIGLFLGFLGAYILSVQSFLGRYPFIAVTNPTVRGSTNW